MKFQKGDKARLGLPNPNAGRKPGKSTQYKKWLETGEHKIVELLDKLYEMGVNGDKDACIYVINRFAGTPKQTVDQRTLQLDFTPDDYIKYSNLILRDNGGSLLTMPNDSPDDPPSFNVSTSQRESQDGIKDDDKAELNIPGDTAGHIGEQ